jgi:hypothetical protein
MFVQRLLLATVILCSAAHIIAKPHKVAIIDVEPFGMKGHVVYGIHKDYLEKVFELANLKVDFSLSPYPRVVSDIQSGVTSAALFFRRNDLKGVVEVGKSIGFNVLLLTHKKKKLDKKKLEGKTIGIIRDAKYEPDFDANEKIEKYPVKNYKQGLLMLAQARIDGLMISEPAFNFYVHSLKGVKESLGEPIFIHTKHNYLYASKGLDKMSLEKIRKANSDLMKNNYLDKVLKKYQ